MNDIPEITSNVSVETPIILLVLICLVPVYVYRRWLVRKWNWYITYSIFNTYHRLRKLYRHLMAGKMPKWKQGLIADIVHDALFEAVHQHVLSEQEYRRACRKVDEALGTDMAPRSRHANAIRKTILENRKAMRSPKPNLPEPEPASVVGLEYLKRRRA